MDDFTILVVEDDPDMLENIQDLLILNHYNVVGHPGGTNVLERIETLKPSTLIVDWMLPGIEGINIVRHVREHPQLRNTPCIMLTAKTATNDIIMGYQTGTDVYLTKPYESGVLLAVIKQIQSRVKNSQSVSEDQIFSMYDSTTPFVRKFLDLVAKHYTDPAMKLGDYAKRLYCSSSSLNAKIKKYSGVSPYAIILDYRLYRSHIMLKELQANVTEAAFSSGFTSLSGFSIAYKKRYGFSPKETQQIRL